MKAQGKIELDSLFSPSDDEDFEPLPEQSYAEYGEYQLVGHGKVTSAYCGKFLHFKGCARVDLHNIITLEGENYRGKVFVRKAHHWCNKPSCPVCFKSGWAIREAGNIEARLAEASKRFGLAEHIVASVPVSDYGLSHKALRAKVRKILAERGIIGGVMLFHGFRYDLERQWYWSPHFHIIGFILGGYSRCRNCDRKWNCLKGCGGFDDRAYQAFLKDGYYVRVMGKRKTVFGTAWYQLHHASVKKNVTRFHVATWFGVCSYRKLKVTVEKRKDMCPICQHDLVKLRYFGAKRFVLDRGASCYEQDSFESHKEGNCVVWMEDTRKRVSGSYEDGEFYEEV